MQKKDFFFHNSIGTINDTTISIGEELFLIDDIVHLEYFYLINGKLDFYLLLIMVGIIPFAFFFNSFYLFGVAVLFGVSSRITFYKDYFLFIKFKGDHFLKSRKVICDKSEDISLFVSNFRKLKKTIQQ